MAISSISLDPSSAGAVTTPAQGALAQRNTRSASTPDDANASARTQLSDLGRTRLSLENVQEAAETARNLNNPPTLSAFRSAVQGIVQSFNALNQTVSEANATDRQSAQALNEVRQAVKAPNQDGEGDLQRLGITAQQDGTFAVNQRLLDASFQQNSQAAVAALDEVADRVEQATDRQLAGPASNPEPAQPRQLQQAAAERNNEDANAQAQDQARANARESFRELLASQLANAGSYSARNAVTTYFSVSTL